MIPQPPPGQGPIDPRGAFSPPPPPGGGAPPPGWQPPAPSSMPPPMPPPPILPPMYPPPMFYGPPPRQKGGFARGIFVTLATTLFGLSLTLNIYLLLMSGLMGGSSARSNNLLDGDPTQKVAVIPIKGIIMDEASAQFDRFLKQAEADSTVKAIVLEIDSPGGSVTASDEIFHRIQRFKADRPNTPVIVSMAGLAASGGYYVSCGADHLFAQPSTLTGNIGVLLPQYNVAELFDKWGIEETTITSEGAPFKNAGSMFRPEQPEERAYLQDIADKAFAQFKGVVQKGRAGKSNFDPKKLGEIANGKIYMADDARKLGLIDDVGYLHDAWEHAAATAGLSNPMVVRYQDPPSLVESLLSGKSSGAAQSVQVSGVNVNAGDLSELLTPRLMYLWRGR